MYSGVEVGAEFATTGALFSENSARPERSRSVLHILRKRWNGGPTFLDCLAFLQNYVAVYLLNFRASRYLLYFSFRLPFKEGRRGNVSDAYQFMCYATSATRK